MSAFVFDSRTDVKSAHLTFNWTIKNFKLMYHLNRQFVKTPTFTVEDGKVKWSIQMYPRGSSVDCLDSVSLCLYLDSYELPTSSINVEGSFSIVKSNTILAKKNFTTTTEECDAVEIAHMVSRRELLEQCQSDDTFIIRCEFIQKIVFVMNSAKHLTLSNSKLHWLGEDCSRLMKKPHQFSDVTIEVGGKNIAAHKFLLAARSSVFAAMFAHNEVEENRTNKIKIEDLEAEVVEGMLEFIYTDQVMNLRNLADRLIVAAQKYDLERLRTICEEALYESLDTDNACDLLILADLHGSHKFTEEIIEFIAKHYSQVIKTKAYERIEDPKLFVRLTRSANLQNH